MIHDATAPELASPDAFEQFFHAFQHGSIPEPEWTHGAHLAMAAALLQRMNAEEAVDAARNGLLHLLRGFWEEAAENRYHETLTRFWIYLSAAFLHESGLQGEEAARALVHCYGKRSGLPREYYSYDIWSDPEARREWQVPDLQALPAAWRRGSLLVSANPDRLHLPTVHAFLSETYWAEGIPLRTVERSIRGSLCFGVYEDSAQVGFARVVTDRATFGYLSDVFILPSHRGRGLSRWLIDCVTAHPSLQGLRRWHLVTRDAQGLYKRYGFRTPDPARHMERVDPNPYGVERS